MGNIVAGWLIDAGVKDGKPAKETETPGAINILRHAYDRVLSRFRQTKIE
jgi:hypothetical protein